MSKFNTDSLFFLIQRKIKLEPIKPAPPVTKIMVIYYPVKLSLFISLKTPLKKEKYFALFLFEKIISIENNWTNEKIKFLVSGKFILCFFWPYTLDLPIWNPFKLAISGLRSLELPPSWIIIAEGMLYKGPIVFLNLIERSSSLYQIKKYYRTFV